MNGIYACDACHGQGFVFETCGCREAACPHEPIFGNPEDPQPGIYQKFWVSRTDGSSVEGGKHHACDYFVLDWAHDPFTVPAALAYADACEATHPDLARDLRARAQQAMQTAGFHFSTCSKSNQRSDAATNEDVRAMLARVAHVDARVETLAKSMGTTGHEASILHRELNLAYSTLQDERQCTVCGMTGAHQPGCEIGENTRAERQCWYCGAEYSTHEELARHLGNVGNHNRELVKASTCFRFGNFYAENIVDQDDNDYGWVVSQNGKWENREGMTREQAVAEARRRAGMLRVKG